MHAQVDETIGFQEDENPMEAVSPNEAGEAGGGPMDTDDEVAVRPEEETAFSEVRTDLG